MRTLPCLIIALAAVALPGLSSCNRNGSGVDDIIVGAATPDTLTHHCHYLTLVDFGNGTTLAEITNPWDSTRQLARYLLVDRDSAMPEQLPADVSVIRTPVQNAAVFSAVHTSAINELGAIGAVKSVADAAYFPKNDTVCALLAQGKVTDVGTSEMPSVERLAAAGTEVVLRSPMQGANAASFPTGMVAVEMADYLETSPISRAEWILLIGRLFGKDAEAQTIFSDVVADYSDLALKVKLADKTTPKVLTETEVSGVWYVPAGKSYQARMLADAGASYPWSDTDGTGSLALSLESVAEKAMDADMWLVRSFGYETTPATLKAMNPRYAAFKAWKDGEVYICNSAERLIFNDMAFHPEKILADYVAIFHPELMPGYELKYFRKTGK